METQREPILRASKVSKHYAMGRAAVEVLCDCSIEVETGEFVVIMGRSGSGKSTLLHVLGALDTPDRGTVELRASGSNGRAGQMTLVHPAGADERNRLRRRNFGFVFQFYHLLPELSVFENVLMTRMVGTSILGWLGARGPARRDAEEILTFVGLEKRLRHRPNELSGGERQRVAFARALVHRPDVLLADEPTGNLDAQAGGRIMELLTSLHQKGQTIVMVTHDQALARFADRLLILEDGQLRGP